jgi:hypothetical protein
MAAIELSDIAAGIGGFVIIGELAGDYSGYSVSSAGDGVSFTEDDIGFTCVGTPSTHN